MRSLPRGRKCPPRNGDGSDAGGVARRDQGHVPAPPAALGGSVRRPGRALPGGPARGGDGGPGPSELPVPAGHAGAPTAGPEPARPRSAPRPGQRLPGGRLLLPGFPSPLPRCRGAPSPLVSRISRIASSGRQRPGSCCQHPRFTEPRPAGMPRPPPGSLLPPPRTQATSVRVWLSQKGRTPFIPWDLKKNQKPNHEISGATGPGQCRWMPHPGRCHRGDW